MGISQPSTACESFTGSVPAGRLYIDEPSV